MTTVNGTYKACGTDASLTYTCTGPNCDILNGYPNMTCTTNGDVLSCNNGVTCDGLSNYTDTFSLSQPDIKVTSSDNIILSDLCEEIIYTSDGTQAGTDCQGVEMSNCTPIVSLSTATSGTATPYSNTSTTHSVETSTILSTKTYTITSCPATVTNCPIGSVATEVFTAYTTYCPGSGASTTPNRSGPAYTSNSGKTASTPAGGASSTFSQVQVSGAIRSRLPSAGLIWCGLLLFFFLFPGALALQDSSPRDVAEVPRLEHAVRHLPVKDPRSYELQKRGIFQDFESAASAIVQYYEGKIPSSDLGQTLVQSLESAVCDLLSGKLLTQGAAWLVDRALGVEIVAECMEIINGIVIATAPEIEVTPGGALLLNFAAKQVCNKMIQLVFHIPQAVNDICSLTKPCTKDFTSDPNHCGRCSISCLSGECKNSACTSNSCTGETCDTFTPCGPGSSCVCASTTEGTGFCVDGNTPCADLDDCATSANCGAGEICGYQTCCTRNVCVGASFCGGAGTSPSRFLRRTWENSTIADPGFWVP